LSRIRCLAVLLLLATIAAADPGLVLVDGTEIPGAVLVEASATEARFRIGEEIRTFKTAGLVAYTEPVRPGTTPDKPFNLYLHNGDRLRGTVLGTGTTLGLDSPHVVGLQVPLDRVRAVRFGRLLGALQARYNEVFDNELERGRDVIVVQRDTKPFPVFARVLEVGETDLVARVETAKRDLPLGKVYGFVRTPDAETHPAPGIRVRLTLTDGSRLTLPVEKITAEAVESGGTSVFRAQVERMEFLGDHIAHLSDFEPIDVKEVALFGTAPHWRRDGMVLGGPLRMSGRVYARGVGAQAYSRLEFVLGGRWDSLFVRCGIDDAAGAEGDARFRILGDGKVLHEVERRRGENPAALRLDVKGVDRLVLEAVPGDSYVSDFCDWAEARVFTAQDPPRDGK